MYSININYLGGVKNMKKRNIGVSILLSIITCGIYALYWFVVLTDESNYASNHTADGTSGGVSLLLNIVTCGIYGIYWGYKLGERVEEAKALRNIPSDSSTNILYLILCIFGLQIIVYALAQNELNKFEDFVA